jgi:hypothetical protein
MTLKELLSLLIMCQLATVITMAVFAVQRKAAEGALKQAIKPQPDSRWIRRLIIGTDTDLKVEAVFLAYLLVVIAILGHRLPLSGLIAFTGVLPLIAVVQGFHLRQWLSKWRFRNIVYVQILTRKRKLYIRGVEEGAAILLNNIIMWWLIFTNPGYALLQIAGFVLHEIITETRKRRRLLRRKLHLFDVDFLRDPAVKESVISAVRHFRVDRVDLTIQRLQRTDEAVLLRAFKYWLQNDFAAFDAEFNEHRSSIEQDAEMTYYFGKAFYALGEVERARDLLHLGWDRHASKICLSYYVLCQLALPHDHDTVTALEDLLAQHVLPHGATRADMFVAAFYSLTIAMGTRAMAGRDDRLRRAFYFIHEAMRINQRIFDRGDVGLLRNQYFEANNQIFMDIYGYLVYRQGNTQLSFSILESAINRDNTYPWPYFHIALIYESVGRRDVADSIYFRVAVNEVSNSVLKRLCIRRLQRVTPATAAVQPAI